MDVLTEVELEIRRLQRELRLERQRHEIAVAGLLARLQELQKQCPHREQAIDRGEYDMPTFRICMLCGTVLDEESNSRV